MSEQHQQPIPVYDAHEPSEASKRVTAILDDLESKQLENANDAGKSLIERIATFLGILFGLSILTSNFPPAYLKGNTPVKVLLFAALASYLLAISAALWATQVRFYHHYTYNATRSQAELVKMIRQKVRWLRLANLLFALGTVLLAVLLLVIVWNV
jgi:tetrahydromethanopterin S-methyltransferase subunit G